MLKQIQLPIYLNKASGYIVIDIKKYIVIHVFTSTTTATTL